MASIYLYRPPKECQTFSDGFHTKKKDIDRTNMKSIGSIHIRLPILIDTTDRSFIKEVVFTTCCPRVLKELWYQTLKMKLLTMSLRRTVYQTTSTYQTQTVWSSFCVSTEQDDITGGSFDAAIYRSLTLAIDAAAARRQRFAVILHFRSWYLVLSPQRWGKWDRSSLWTTLVGIEWFCGPSRSVSGTGPSRLRRFTGHFCNL